MLSPTYQRYLKMFLITLIVLSIGYFLIPVSYPIIAAFIIGLILTPLVRWCSRLLKVNRVMSVTIIFTLFLLFMVTFFFVAITQLITQGISFFENLPSYLTNINESWNAFVIKVETSFSNFPDVVLSSINDQITLFLNEMRSTVIQLDIISAITAALTRIPGYLVSFLVFMIALFLFMVEMPRLKTGFYSQFSEGVNQRIQFMVGRFSKVISGFLKAQFIVSIPIFIVSLIGLFLITPSVALTMAIVIWIIDFIPLIGSIVILAPWATYLLFTGDTSTGIQLFVLAAILLIMRRTIEPKVMGEQIGLSPLATLISMYLGAQLIGFTGLIIGPLLVIGFNSAREAGIIKIPKRI